MAHYLIKDLFTKLPEADIPGVKVSGWVRTIRESKAFAFVELNDGTYFKNLQIILEAGKLPDYDGIVKSIATGAAIEAEGVLTLTPEMKQPFELKAEQVTVVGESPSDYPLQKKRHTLEYLRTIQHLRPRANLFQCAFRVRSVAAQAIHRFFHDKGYLYVHTPLITGSDCEGAGEMFRVTTLDPDALPLNDEGKTDYSKDFFGKPVSLTVSGQLNAEIFAMAFRNVYTFGPTFRAEESYTPRHAAEFWMIEPEIAFADLSIDMDLQEEMVKYIIAAVLEECPEEMAFLNSFVDKGLVDRLAFVRDSEFVRCTALPDREALRQAGVRHRLAQGDQGLLHAHERRRQNRGRGRPAGARRGRTVRRQPARGALRRAEAAHRGAGHEPRGLLVVPGAAQVRHREARRFRYGLRADDHVPDGHSQHPRRAALPAHHRQRRFLNCHTAPDLGRALFFLTRGNRLGRRRVQIGKGWDGHEAVRGFGVGAGFVPGAPGGFRRGELFGFCGRV